MATEVASVDVGIESMMTRWGLLRGRGRLATVVLLVGIVVLAGVLRMTDLAENPPGFYADEASVGYNAYTVLHTGRDERGLLLPIFFPAFGEHRPPVFVYSAMPFIGALGLTETAVRLTGATYGTLTVLAVFLLASTLFGKRVGLGAAFLLAVTPWHIHYSRTGFELITFPFFFSIAITLFLVGLNRPRMLAASVIVGVVTLYTYWSAWLMVPLTVAGLALLYRDRLVAHRRSLARMGIIVGVLAIPFVVNLVTGGVGRLEHSSVIASDAGVLGAPLRVISGYFSYFSLSFLVSEGDQGPILRHYLPGHGQLYGFMVVLVIVGAIRAAVRHDRAALVLLGLLLMYPLPGALSDSSPISSRTIFGSVVLAMTAAYGAAGLASLLTGRLRRQRWAADAVVAMAVVALALWGLGGYVRGYEEYPEVAAGFWGWQSGPREVVGTFAEAQDEYDDLVLDWEFNSADIFLKFYAPDGCDGCVSGGMNLLDRTRRQLFALKPEHITAGVEYEVLGVVDYPNGQRAFVIFEVQ